MLAAWLPVMLGWFWRPTKLIDALEIMGRYCETQAAAELRNNARFIDEHRTAINESVWTVPIDRAQKWLKRRAVLAEAVVKLQELG